MISTEIIKLNPQNPEKKKILYAAQILRRGGLVIFPTETVYGIGANLLKEETIRKLYQIKQRPQNKPFSIHISRKEEVENYATDIPPVAYRLMDKFWPGPLTLILKADSGSVGLRLPDNEIAQRLISSAEVPIVAPSANISGRPPPADFKDAIRDFKGLVELGIDAGRTKFGRESTIVDVRTKPAQIIREEAIKKEDIEDIIKKKVILFVCTGNSCRSVMAKFYLEKRLKDLGRNDVEVISRGIAVYEGLGVTVEVKKILEEEGIDSSSHIAQKLSPAVIKKSDLVLVMERLQEEEVKRLVPEAKNRVFLLKEFVKLEEADLNIYDPIGKPLEVHRETFAVVKEAIERLLKII